MFLYYPYLILENLFTKNLSSLLRFQWRKLLKYCHLSNYLLVIMQTGSLFSRCCNLIYNDTSNGIFFVMVSMHLIGFTCKNLKNKDFPSLT